MTHDQRDILAHGLLIFAVTCVLAMVAPRVGIVPATIFLLATLALARRCRKWTWLFNLITALGLAVIAGAIGARVSANALLITFTLVSFYDIVAVYGTGHMVRMFRSLASRGIVLAFVLPAISTRTLAHTKYLGIGDVALPAMLAVAAARGHLVYGLAVTLGAMIGFKVMCLLSFRQERRRPMPAFPPIALGAMVLYLVSLILVP